MQDSQTGVGMGIEVDEAIDKAGDIVDEKTQGKYKDAIHKVEDVAKGAVDKPNPDT